MKGPGGTGPSRHPSASGGSAAPSNGSPNPGGKPPVAFSMPAKGAGPTGSLNARLKDLTVNGNVDYTPKHVALGDAQSVFNDAMAAYDARLAPPPDILRRTFGFIYERRTTTHPDSLAYVYDTYSIGPITVCKAWKIVEHPYVVESAADSVPHGAGLGGGVVTNANSPVVRHAQGGTAEVETVQFPCSEKSYTAVRRGSLTTPLPRHPDAPAPLVPVGPGTPTPSPSFVPVQAPQPAASLAP